MNRCLPRFLCRVHVILSVAAVLLATAAPAAFAQFNTNLVVNPGAESAAGGNGNFAANLPGWTVSGELTAIAYSTGGGYPTLADPGPAAPGLNFFGGGNVGTSTGTQVIDLGFAAAEIAASNAQFTLSGWLGGYLSQADNATLMVTFRDAANTTLGSSTLGPVTAADRGNLTGTFLRSSSGAVPLGTSNALVTLLMTRAGGTSNDGYADNLSLAISAVPEPGTAVLMACGAMLLALRRRLG